MRRYVLLILVSCLAVPDAARATSEFAKDFTLSIESYSQNFNSLASTGASNTWTDQTTIDGWYTSRTTYAASNGSSTTGVLHSFGSTGSSERSLGGLASSGTGTIFFGLKLRNSVGGPITSIKVDFTGEQWRKPNSGAQNLIFTYSFSATSITTGTYTSVSALTFTSPRTGAGDGNAGIDGNATGNRTGVSALVALASPWANGGTLWLRWADAEDSGNNHALAVDDLTVTVPEPASLALLALAIPMLYRRR